MNNEVELIVIGGGAAGMAAAISAYDNGVKDILILEKDDHLGGILNQCIHNGFGLHTFKEELTGPEYADRFMKQVYEKDIKYLLNTMVLEISDDLVVTYSNNTGFYKTKAKAIVMATGCMERTPGQIRLLGDRPSGVMTAGLAQKYLNIDGYMVGKKVFILGSGDIGLIMARRMTLEGAKVLGVAELMPYSNGLNRNIVQCLNDFNIPLYLSCSVKEVIGKSRLEKIVLCDVDEKRNFIPGTERIVECDTLLLSVGLVPSNQLLESLHVKINPRTKGPEVYENMETSHPGIFACGNSLHVHDLVDYVSSEAGVAGASAAKYIKENTKSSSESLITTPQNGVGYLVPAYIHKDSFNTSTLKFRVTAPVKDVVLNILLDGEVIKSYKKPFLIPSQMENISLASINVEPELLKKAQNLSVEVVK